MRSLVIRPGALGDVLLTLPALQALSAAFPQAPIELMGNLAVIRWLPGRSVVRAVSSFDRADLVALFQTEPMLAAPLREYLGSFDLILSYATAPEHVFARNLARVGRRVWLLDSHPPAGPVHMSAYLQQPLTALGVAPEAGHPALHLTPTDQQEAARWWQAHGLGDAAAVAIHPGSGSSAKNWPAARFAAVARHLQRERGMRLLLVSGPADEAAVDGLRQRLSDPGRASSSGSEQDAIVLQEPPLPLLAAILSRCQLYVGNDSGVSHLAAALGVPTVAIFGPTDPDVWAPHGPAVRIVRAATPCLEAVSVQMVLDAIT